MHLKFSTWAFVLISMFHMMSANALFAEFEASKKPVIEISVSNRNISLGERFHLNIESSWKGGPDDFRFLIPTDFKLTNLRYLQTAQSASTNGERQIKRFQFEFEPISAGKGKVEAFNFLYVPGNTAGTTFSHSIDEIEIDINNPKSKRTFFVITLALIGTGAIALFFIGKKRKKPIKLVNSESLESVKINELEQASDLKKIGEILASYRDQKWHRDKSLYSKDELKQIQLFEKIFSEIEQYKFGGLKISPLELQNLKQKSKSLIEQYQIVERS